jgi:hypothetical protein
MPPSHSSAVWDFFDEPKKGQSPVICLVCHIQLSRGQKRGSFTTKPMWNHLMAKHPEQHTIAKAKDEAAKAEKAAASNAPDAVASTSTSGDQVSLHLF